MQSRARMVNIILSRFFEKHQMLLNFFIWISHFIPHSVLRRAIQFESLSFHEQFILKGGYKDLFYLNLRVSKEDLVLVLGAFRGDSVSQWRSRFHCKVFAVEPMPDALCILQELFNNDNCVQIYSSAVSDYTGNIEFGVSGDSTGAYLQVGERITLPVIDVAELFATFQTPPVCIELNIEGGEYAVLTRLWEKDYFPSINTFLIQFHNYGFENEIQRAQIRKNLSKTHELVFDFPWIWERWDKRK